MRSHQYPSNGRRTIKPRSSAAYYRTKYTRHSPYHIPHSRDTGLSLQAFLSNVFYSALISDDDEIAESVYEQNWSRHVKEDGNGTRLNFHTFHEFLFQVRKEISNRKLVSQSFVVANVKNQGLTGEVGHFVTFTGVEDGKEKTGHIIAIVQIKLEDGVRKIEMESFVLHMDDDPVPTRDSMLSTEVFIKNICAYVLIGDDEEIFELAFDKYWNHHASRNAQGKKLDFRMYRNFLEKTRAEITHRESVSEKVIVHFADEEGLTATAGHVVKFLGLLNGKEVEATGMAVFNISFEHGQRKIETESLVFETHAL